MDLTRAARGLDPAEAAVLAAEALPLDNEALREVALDDEDLEDPGGR